MKVWENSKKAVETFVCQLFPQLSSFSQTSTTGFPNSWFKEWIKYLNSLLDFPLQCKEGYIHVSWHAVHFSSHNFALLFWSAWKNLPTCTCLSNWIQTTFASLMEHSTFCPNLWPPFRPQQGFKRHPQSHQERVVFFNEDFWLCTHLRSRSCHAGAGANS